MNKTNQTATVTLNTAIVQGEQTIKTLTLRKPLAGDLRGVKLLDFLQADVDALTTVLPRITVDVVLTPHSVQGLDFIDLTNIQVGLASFFPSAQQG